jgi:PKD repeat protein
MHVPFVAAGECTRQHYTNQQDLLLHTSYGDIHPNLNGSYLVACAMFTTIFQEPVLGVNYNAGVTISNASYFQGIADNVVLPNKSLWRINTYNLHAEFNALVTNNSVDFTNLSTNYTSLLWDFGDGVTSLETNPNHIYTSTGNKTITLTVYKNGCSESYSKTIQINSLHVNNFETSSLKIYQNYNSNELIIEGELYENFKLYAITGAQLLSFDKNQNYYSLNTSQFPKGIYILKSNSIIYKFII